MPKDNNDADDDGPQVGEDEASQRQEAKSVDVSHGKDVFVVDFGVKNVSKINLLHLEQENVGGIQFMVLLFLEYKIGCFFDIF